MLLCFEKNLEKFGKICQISKKIVVNFESGFVYNFNNL